MQRQRKTIFISDLHLQKNQPHTTNCFLNFLSNLPSNLDSLYILGDLFEIWIGDDDHNEFHEQIISALRQATRQGLAIYFMHGNRDFLIGKKFFQQTGCVELNEEEKISLYGTPLLLMHGDTLCTLDTNYIKARKILRQPLLQFLFLSLPLRVRQSIANHFRNKSKTHTSMTSMEEMDATTVAIENYMQKHQVTYLIHGHTHKPAIHETKIQNTTATRIVLGAWHEGGNALIWDAAGHKRLVNFTSLSSSLSFG